MFETHNKKTVLVTGNKARSTTTTIAGLAAGEIAVAEQNGNTIMGNATAASLKGKKLQFVLKDLDGKYHKSPVFDTNNVLNYNATKYAADVQFVHYLGYNGTSGGIEVPTNSITYNVTARRFNILNGDYDKWFNNKTTSWVAPATGTLTGTDLAYGLFENFVMDYNNEIDGYMTPALINGGSGTVLGGTSTLAVTQYSTFAVASSSSHALVAGDFVRIGGTALTTPIYKVKSVNSTLIEFTTPYLGATATVANANCLEVTVSTTAWGIKFTGVNKYFNAGRFNYDLFDQHLWLNQAWLTTAITYTTKPNKGQGTYNEVAEMEWQAYENRTGQFFENDMPPRYKPLNATSGVTYNLLSLMTHNDTKMFVQSAHQNYHNIVIALPAAGETGAIQSTDTTSTKPIGIIAFIDLFYEAINGAAKSPTFITDLGL